MKDRSITQPLTPRHDCPLSLSEQCTSQMLTLHQFAESLGNAVDAKDTCTCEHSEEVAVISQILALRLGLSPREAEMIHLAGHLHDIGKIGIPDAILSKPGRLTAKEMAVIRRHPAMGADIIRPVKILGERGGVSDIILQHHERYNGSGYPHGLSGQSICLGARIIAVSDSLSAMLQPRPYKPRPMTFDEAAKEIKSLGGTLYDPRVVEAFDQARDHIRSWVAGIGDIQDPPLKQGVAS